MAGYLGNAPTAVPLTSADIADGIITSAKIVDGTIVNADINASSAIAISKLSATGTSLQVLRMNSGATALEFATLGGGITEADQWRITTNLTGVTSAVDVTANWERNDSTGYSVLGTGMTESSGIFTFPSTGYYLIQFFTNMQSTTATSYMSNIINVTTNNSTYVGVCNSDTNAFQGSVYSTLSIEYIFDVTSTANCKIKFAVQASNSANFLGDSTVQKTGVTFIRLGDT